MTKIHSDRRKILALTDIHGAYIKARNIIAKEKADVVIIGGDLTTVGTVKEAEEAIAMFQLHTSRVFCVAGNMDMPQHDDLFARLGVSLNGRGVVFRDVGFFGVSAAPHSHLHTPYEISEEEILQRAQAGYADVRHCAKKIFVPHAPPYGTKLDIIHTGIHVGSTAVREFIEEQSPDVVLCGHIHEGRGKDQIGTSQIINCGAAFQGCYAVVQLDETALIENRRFSG